jgi:lipid-binding SYLF domain-containing protein
MRRALIAAALATGCGTLLPACQDNNPSPSQAYQSPSHESEQQLLIDKAKLAVEALRSDPTLGGTVNDTLAKARGVLVFPNLVKAGFFFGGGQGVLLVRQGAGWSDPVFVYAADASFGLQIGAEGGQVLFAVMNDGALQKLVHGNADLGGDLSVAVGPVGAGAQAATTPNIGTDLIAFSLQQGIFAGATIKGGVVAPRQEWNAAYYGPGAAPDLIVRGAFNRPGDRELKVALSNPPPRRTSSAQ